MKRKIVTLIVCIFTFLSFVFSVPIYADGENITMKADIGFDGSIKINKWTPVTVQIKNNGNDVNGQLDVIVPDNTTDGVAYSVPAVIPSGTEKRFKLYVNVTIPPRNIDVLLKQDDKTIKKLVLDNLKIAGYNKYMVGILTEDKSALSYWEGSLGENRIFNTYETIYFNEESFPDKKEVVDNFSIIIVNNFDTSSLSKKQLNALKQWTEGGGTLIIGTGASGYKTLKGISQYFNSIKAGDVYSLESIPEIEAITGKDILKNTGFELMNITANNANQIVSSSGHGIIYNIPQNKGEIFVSAFDIGLEPVVSWTGSKLMWDNLLTNYLPADKVKWLKEERTRKDYERNRTCNMQRYINDALSNIKAMDMPSFGILLIVLILYLLVVGPLNYIILKKKDKREWAWFTIPICAVIFGICIFATGYVSKGGGRIITNKVSVIKVNNDSDSADLTSYFGVFVPKKDNYDVEIEDDSLISLNNNGRYYNLNNTNNFNQEKELNITSKVIEGTPSTIRFYNTNIWTMRDFSINETLENFGKIDAQLYYDDKKIKGSITNNTLYPINDLTIYMSGRYKALGNFAAGETKQVDFDIVTYSLDKAFSLNIYDMLDDLYPTDFKRSIFAFNSITDKNRENMIKSRLISSIFIDNTFSKSWNNAEQASARIFGFCNSKTGQDIKVNNEYIKDSHYNSIVFCDADISLEKTKTISILPNMIKGTIDESTLENIGYDGSGVYLKDKKCVFKFDISKYKDFDISNVKFYIDMSPEGNWRYSLYEVNKETFVDGAEKFAVVRRIDENIVETEYPIPEYKHRGKVVIELDNKEISRFISEDSEIKLGIESTESTWMEIPTITFEGRRD